MPIGINGGEMVFQVCFGYPVEVRSLAVFAMGIPVLCALAGWQHWRMDTKAAA